MLSNLERTLKNTYVKSESARAVDVLVTVNTDQRVASLIQ